ncbi:MAG: hypothetical protein WHV64_11860, partial [Geminicoccaceae bacterium]
MSRARSSFVCQACGAVHPRWAGRCESCGAWNTIAEEPASTASGPGARTPSAKRGKGIELLPLRGSETPPLRLSTGID